MAELDIELPDVAFRRDDGAILFNGTRVGLYVFLDNYLHGETLSELRERFPHIPAASMERVIEHFEANRAVYEDWLQRYTAEYEERTKNIPVLDIEQLRARYRALNATKQVS